MSIFEIIIISAIIGGSIFLAIGFSFFRLVAGMFFAPYTYYPFSRRAVGANDAKGNSPMRIYFTMVFLFLLLMWMATTPKAEGMYKPTHPEFNTPNTAVMSGMISLPDAPSEEKEAQSGPAVEKKDNPSQFFAQFAAIIDLQLAEETQQRLSEFLNREVIILKNGTWHFLLVGPFHRAEDAAAYAKSTGLENLVKSNDNL